MTGISDLDGKAALVTGASSGLGRHFAGVLARAGARVALAARRVDSLEEVRAAIAGAGGTAVVVELDVTDAGFGQARGRRGGGCAWAGWIS